MISDKKVAEKIALKLNSGYWSAGDNYFFDKRACLQHASKFNIGKHSVKFHWFDSVFETVKWNTPPQQSLPQLYRQRAQQLRDKYDYLVLAFSGGADSTNVLDTFLDNNIAIDEIVCYYTVEVVDKLMPTFNPLNKSRDKMIFEYNMACAPKLQEVVKNHPNIKITILDYTRDAIDLVGSSNALDMDMAGMSMSPVLAGHVAVSKRLKELSETISKVACIFAVDKPRMLYNNNTQRFGTYFADFSTIYCKTNMQGFWPNIEPFYWSPDLPELVQAQAYLLKNSLAPAHMFDSRPKWYTDIILTTYPQAGIEIIDSHTDFVKAMLYPRWTPDLWQAEKNYSLFYHDNCAWFWSDLIDKRTKDYYNGQLHEWLDGVRPDLITFEKNRPDRFVDLFSQTYWF